jgi:hypothetical protein
MPIDGHFYLLPRLFSFQPIKQPCQTGPKAQAAGVT